MSRCSRILAVAGSLTALCGVMAVLEADNSVASAKIPQSTCFWTDQLASKFFNDAAHNFAFPDTGAVYWTAQITMAPGSRIVVTGSRMPATSP